MHAASELEIEDEILIAVKVALTSLSNEIPASAEERELKVLTVPDWQNQLLQKKPAKRSRDIWSRLQCRVLFGTIAESNRILISRPGRFHFPGGHARVSSATGPPPDAALVRHKSAIGVSSLSDTVRILLKNPGGPFDNLCQRGRFQEREHIDAMRVLCVQASTGFNPPSPFGELAKCQLRTEETTPRQSGGELAA